MFRVKESDDPRDYSLATGVLAFSLLVAFAVDISFAYITWQECRALNVLQRVAEIPTRSTVISLQRTVGLLAILTMAMFVSLAVSLAAMWWLFRRRRTHRRSLRQVKTLAYNILSSVDQGVITTDADECVTSINSAASGLLGVDFECVGQPLEHVQPGEVALTTMTRQVTTGQGPVWAHDLSRAESAWRMPRAFLNFLLWQLNMGTSLQDWLQAEAELKAEIAYKRRRR